MASLAELLTAVRDEAGVLTPAAVVEAATPEAHPLHHRFEWDDAVAGHKYRLVQAGDLIRHVRVQYTATPTGEPVTVRAFVSVSSDDDPMPTYIPVAEAMSSELSAALVLRQFRAQLVALRRQYQHLSDYRQMIEQELLGEVR